MSKGYSKGSHTIYDIQYHFVWVTKYRHHILKATSPIAQKNGDIRSDIKPEFLMLVVDKVYELVKGDQWKSVFSDFGQFQEQVRTLIFFGLLTRS